MPLVKPGKSKPLIGNFKVKIVGSEIKTSKKGSQYVSWKLETMSLDKEIDGRWIFMITPLEGKGAGMFKHFVHAAGDKAYEDGEYDTDKLNGKTMNVTTEENYMPDGTISQYPRVVEIWACEEEDDISL